MLCWFCQYTCIKIRWAPFVHPGDRSEESTGVFSQMKTKLHGWAVWQTRAGCYSQAALSSNHSKTQNFWAGILSPVNGVTDLPTTHWATLLKNWEKGSDSIRLIYIMLKGTKVHQTKEGLSYIRGKTDYRAQLKGFGQVVWMLQASSGRSGKQQH